MLAHHKKKFKTKIKKASYYTKRSKLPKKNLIFMPKLIYFDRSFCEKYQKVVRYYIVTLRQKCLRLLKKALEKDFAFCLPSF